MTTKVVSVSYGRRGLQAFHQRNALAVVSGPKINFGPVVVWASIPFRFILNLVM